MATITLIPSGNTGMTGMSVDSSYPISRAYTDADSTTYARFNLNQSTTAYVYLTFDTSDIPANATITSVTARGKARVSNTTRVTNTVMQLYANTTAKGSNRTFASTTASTQNITAGSWTRTELNNLRLRVGGTASSSSSSRRIDFYGADVTVTYQESEVHVTGVSLDKHTASVEQGGTDTLTATVTPNNATDKSVTWTSSNTSVATVDANGVVTGVAPGSATITVKTTDGNYTDSCAYTVSAAVLYDYVLASTMQPGKSYLLANGNSGSVYLLSNEANGSRTLKGIAVTVSGGKISINGATKAKAEFSCSLSVSSNPVTTCVMNDGKYLYCDNANGLRLYSTGSIDRFWHYNGTKFWQFKNTSSDGYTDTSSEYKYYLTVSNGNFTDNHVTSTSIADSTIPAIYLFQEDTGDTDAIYFKNNGAWVEASAVYKKINGSWVLQSDLTNVFQSGVNYVKGN